MENDTYYLVGKIIESVQNIEHYLIKRQKKNILQNVLKNMLVVIKKR